MEAKIYYGVLRLPSLAPNLSKVNPLQANPFYLRSVLILSFHLRLRLPGGLFLSGFLTKALYAFRCSIWATRPVYLTLRELITLIIFDNYKQRTSELWSFLKPRSTPFPTDQKQEKSDGLGTWHARGWKRAGSILVGKPKGRPRRRKEDILNMDDK